MQSASKIRVRNSIPTAGPGAHCKTSVKCGIIFFYWNCGWKSYHQGKKKKNLGTVTAVGITAPAALRSVNQPPTLGTSEREHPSEPASSMTL